MYQVELVKILKEALDYLGCDPSIIADIDHHSTIELTFDSSPTLLISFVDDNVILWSQLAPVNPDVLVACAPRIIESLVAEYQWAANGQLHLVAGAEWYELRAIVNPEFMENGERFGIALESFFEIMKGYYEVLK
ncbi:hypothetical protein C3432_01930 [Citrobacter amalonaticus]|uniref:Uncharacterized protein n=1 Tax=Citrobacter amalonaticus TaxID=35703 RepID=A0A2S4S2J7_CITAM|nr:hypothetical protein [Citrobacter amalonaticus]POT59506.1 hypothetical protein C3432_01930 [Citrobacter amalonaticus]POT77636.1 hypothetical protein C3436_09600 [Citrobacter amalonaticus]POU68088.1 hypothetical protein C3430_03135 [Citrobacter amalonaticus]POV07692.1 hypothetical protein C3424_03145 [Citrobacter amalonaticus]